MEYLHKKLGNSAILELFMQCNRLMSYKFWEHAVLQLCDSMLLNADELSYSSLVIEPDMPLSTLEPRLASAIRNRLKNWIGLKCRNRLFDHAFSIASATVEAGVNPKLGSDLLEQFCQESFAAISKMAPLEASTALLADSPLLRVVLVLLVFAQATL